jgi:hypothetical protein
MESYSKEQLEKMIEQMHKASDDFYKTAKRIGFHQFIEFAGFMNEFIKCCESAAKAGIDFTTEHLPMEHYEAGYIGEKFDCIFGDTLRENPKLVRAFISRFLPSKGAEP